MKRALLIFLALASAGCVQTQTLSQFSPEAMAWGLGCFEAIHGPLGEAPPDPELTFTRPENSACVEGPEDKKTMACAGPNDIDLVIGRWDMYRNGRVVLAHEYLHVLYYQYTDVPADFHHDDWSIEFDIPECLGIPFRSITDVHYHGEEQ